MKTKWIATLSAPDGYNDKRTNLFLVEDGPNVLAVHEHGYITNYQPPEGTVVNWLASYADGWKFSIPNA